MVADVVSRRDEIDQLCMRYRVRTLYLFGSGARDELTDESDLDFLVEFDNPVVPGYADRYFGLMEELEKLFGRPIDLVSNATITNPFLRESIEQSRVLLYAA